MAIHNDIGKEGENMAVAHLVKQGYKIEERNWTRGKLEIDIIARKGETLAIVEVKTRTGIFAGQPYMAVNKTKQRHLVLAADRYIKEKDLDVNARFDIISIVLEPGKNPLLNHIEEAYHSPLR